MLHNRITYNQTATLPAWGVIHSCNWPASAVQGGFLCNSHFWGSSIKIAAANVRSRQPKPNLTREPQFTASGGAVFWGCNARILYVGVQEAIYISALSV